MNKQELVERFMAASYLYFQLKNTTAEELSNNELTELFEALNSDCDSMMSSDYLV